MRKIYDDGVFSVIINGNHRICTMVESEVTGTYYLTNEAIERIEKATSKQEVLKIIDED